VNLKLPQDYRERVYSGWLGKCIGVRLGVPVETWTYQEIAEHVGEIRDFLPLPPGKIFKPDDDTAFPMILIRALQDFGAEVSAEQIGETVLNYVAEQRGTLWWGGYGVSTEHTAYANLAAGIGAPRSGSMKLNGKALAEQIGGQIFSDIWGLVAPGNPLLAAAYAEKASSVTHDGEGIYGGRFIAALVSAAFGESNPARLVEIGLDVIPQHSEYARVTHAIVEFHGHNPDNWRACYQFLAKNFGYDRYAGAVPIIPNAGVVTMALLYSNGDFPSAVRIATNAGWDTDCNAGNVGCILGVAVGLDGIDPRWREPMNDFFVAASVVGSQNLWTIPAAVDVFARGGELLAGLPSNPLARFHFDYRGATHGFQSDSESVVGLEQVSLDDHGALKIAINDLRKKSAVRVYTRTYIRPRELSANYYGASFSPQLYPGQCVTAQLYLPEEAPEGLLAALYVWDDNQRVLHQAASIPLKAGMWQPLIFEIPPLDNALFTQVGIVIRTLGEPWRGHVLLDDLGWSGEPQFTNDFQLERAEYGAVSQWTFLRGFWRLQDGAYHGSGIGVCASYTGDKAWRDIVFTANIVPLAGEHHNVNVRVRDARHSYAVGLAPHNQVVLYKNEGVHSPVASAPFPWEHDTCYQIQVQAVGPTITVCVNGSQLLESHDSHQPYLSGQIGISNWAASHTRVERIAVRGNDPS
jgi:ADP-ribosylglycohydrolase